MMMRLALLPLLLILSGCVTYPDITQSHSPCRMEPGGWCSFVREAAVEAYPYAIAATSAYEGDWDVYPDDKLGVGLKRIARREGEEIDAKDLAKGFSYEIFDQYKVVTVTNEDGEKIPTRGKYIARIMAFRGTDLGFKDVWYGSLKKSQIDIAKRYFQLELDKPDAPDISKWIVAGHSLGGALATEISAMYPDVPAYMFNTSPFLKVDPTVNDMQRTVINERGDWLGEFRKYDEVPAARIVVLNCSPHKGSFNKHRIRRLADCITWIAAYDSYDAQGIVKANAIKRPAVECDQGLVEHPGPESRQAKPCVHIARPKNSD